MLAITKDIMLKNVKHFDSQHMISLFCPVNKFITYGYYS